MAFSEWVYTDALYMYMYIGGSFSELDERCERAERTNLSCVGFATVVFRSSANFKAEINRKDRPARGVR